MFPLLGLEAKVELLGAVGAFSGKARLRGLHLFTRSSFLDFMELKSLMSKAFLCTAWIMENASSILSQCSIAFSIRLQYEENTSWFMGSGIGSTMSVHVSMALDSVMNLMVRLVWSVMISLVWVAGLSG